MVIEVVFTILGFLTGFFIIPKIIGKIKNFYKHRCSAHN